MEKIKMDKLFVFKKPEYAKIRELPHFEIQSHLKFRVDRMTAEREKWLVRELSRVNEKRSRPVVFS